MRLPCHHRTDDVRGNARVGIESDFSPAPLPKPGQRDVIDRRVATTDMQQHPFAICHDGQRVIRRLSLRRDVIESVASTKYIEPLLRQSGKPLPQEAHVLLVKELSTRENTTLRTVSA